MKYIPDLNKDKSSVNSCELIALIFLTSSPSIEYIFIEYSSFVLKKTLVKFLKGFG